MSRKTRQCQIEAATRYNKKNSQTLNIRLNNKTDKDIIEAISLKSSKSGYIKSLIREDLKLIVSPNRSMSVLEDDSYLKEIATLIDEYSKNCIS